MSGPMHNFLPITGNSEGSTGETQPYCEALLFPPFCPVGEEFLPLPLPPLKKKKNLNAFPFAFLKQPTFALFLVLSRQMHLFLIHPILFLHGVSDVLKRENFYYKMLWLN